MCAELKSYDDCRGEMASLKAKLMHTENVVIEQKKEVVNLTISAGAFEKARNELQFRYDTEKGVWVAEVAGLKREVKFWRLTTLVAVATALALAISH